MVEREPFLFVFFANLDDRGNVVDGAFFGRPDNRDQRKDRNLLCKTIIERRSQCFEVDTVERVDRNVLETVQADAENIGRLLPGVMTRLRDDHLPELAAASTAPARRRRQRLGERAILLRLVEQIENLGDGQIEQLPLVKTFHEVGACRLHPKRERLEIARQPQRLVVGNRAVGRNMAPVRVRVVAQQPAEVFADFQLHWLGGDRRLIRAVVRVEEHRRHLRDVGDHEDVRAHVAEIAGGEPRIGRLAQPARHFFENFGCAVEGVHEGLCPHVLRGNECRVSWIEVGAPVNVVFDDRKEAFAEKCFVFGLRPEKERLDR